MENANQVISQHDANDFESRMAFARFLAKNYPERSIKGWEMALMRHELDEGYTYNDQTDTYEFTVGQVTHQLSGDVHKLMIHQYINGASIDSMASLFYTTVAFIKRWRALFGITRDSAPVTINDIISKDTDALAEQIVASKKSAAEIKANSTIDRQTKKDAEKWRNLEDSLLSHIKDNLSKAPKTVPRLKLKPTSNPYALVVCPTDFHWGKYGWSDEVGETYNFEEARERLFTKTQRLIERISVAPEKIYVGAGSDWFHVDNDFGTTTKGTPQDMCASPAEILITGCQLAREHIDLLRQIAPVEVIMMAGNHDRHSTIALMMYLSAAYENVDDVTIVITPNNRRYITYGDTLLGFTHGDGLSRKQSMAGLMAVEAREQWGLTKHKVWFHGHLHHQRLTENNGCLIVQMPSLAGHDRYHARAGYTTSTAGLAAYLIDRDEGYIGSLFAPVTHED